MYAMGLFLTATVIRFRAETPRYFKAISDSALALYGAAIILQPDLLDLLNFWKATGLHPLPLLGYLSSGLAGLGAGLQIVARLTANLATLTRRQIEIINPGQPEIGRVVL